MTQEERHINVKVEIFITSDTPIGKMECVPIVDALRAAREEVIEEMLNIVNENSTYKELKCGKYIVKVKQ